MWAEILLENRAAVKKAIYAIIENLSEAAGLLDAEDRGALDHYLAEARLTRERIKGAKVPKRD
jgi:prephenate dehydrogenase